MSEILKVQKELYEKNSSLAIPFILKAILQNKIAIHLKFYYKKFPLVCFVNNEDHSAIHVILLIRQNIFRRSEWHIICRIRYN